MPDSSSSWINRMNRSPVGIRKSGAAAQTAGAADAVLFWPDDLYATNIVFGLMYTNIHMHWAAMPAATPWFVRARLKTRQLMLLLAIEEEGNIHRAAETLNMSQPAASKLLKDLEDMMEVPLFERLPRGMRPTWYGEAMIRHARIALSSLNQAHDELTALKAGSAGQVNIGAITAPG